MTAIQAQTRMDVRGRRRLRLAANSGRKLEARNESAVRGRAVRPDRPHSHENRLYAVPSADSLARIVSPVTWSKRPSLRSGDQLPAGAKKQLRRKGRMAAAAGGASRDQAVLVKQSSRGYTAPISRMSRVHSKPARASQTAVRFHEQLAQGVLQTTLFIFALVALFAIGMALATLLGLGVQPGEAITVLPGDTLWSLASAVEADVPTSKIVSDIIALNGLEGPEIIDGMKLMLPAY
ncbi:LysM peptidoglycan-binding domain-containing protein [Trueperella bialowiezensis]|uniref:LysM domain-containing protein n=1 Tax=Trueperella bialowiezensis TaxID=312285 RepID=A0A448PCB8_9ACTO|nr:LysM peptidoglycan-binding domain-containing protein [Trueperella bialowiezensis]VEI12619.1 Uncharacterised protein [Trueperella bialowiezensis]